jgi:hypothetical protein
MAEYGVGDEASIKEVLDEVDKDKVSAFLLLITKPFFFHSINSRPSLNFAGWENRLRRVCRNDEEGKLYLRKLCSHGGRGCVYMFQQMCQVQATKQV